jgi:purine-nucleoside phosphorylase
MSRLVAESAGANGGPPSGVNVMATRSGCHAVESALSCHRRYRRIVGLGFFGGISPEVGVGDILVPSLAVFPPGFRGGEWAPDEGLVAALKHASEWVAATRTGMVATVPEFVTEETSKVRALRARGVVGVDMETACFFAQLGTAPVGRAVLLVCSDHVARKPLAEARPLADGRLPLTRRTRKVAQVAFRMVVRLLSGEHPL